MRLTTLACLLFVTLTGCGVRTMNDVFTDEYKAWEIEMDDALELCGISFRAFKAIGPSDAMILCKHDIAARRVREALAKMPSAPLY